MKRNNDFILRKLYGEYILMPIRNNEASNDPISFNAVAAAIWENAEKCDTQEDLTKEISKLFSLKEDSAEVVSVNSFIDQLIGMKLIYTESKV